MVPARYRLWLASCLACAALGAAAQPAGERFDGALHRHVRDGVVDYPAIADDADFHAYIEALRDGAAPRSKAERLVHYMNAYNALAIQGIVDGLSPATLLGRVRFFKLKRWRLDGAETSLYDLEREAIVPLGEPRIHFSIVCASISCPKLRSEAYTVERLQAQLEEDARAFINDPARNRFDRGRGVAYLSEIFKRYEEDFAREAGSLRKYLAKYVNDPEAARDLARERYSIEWISYDWSLNGTPPLR